MADGKLQISIVTPSNAFFDGEADYVQIPMHDGLIGVLPDHVGMMGVLGYGVLTLRESGTEILYIIDGGFVEVSKNKVTVLANAASSSDSVDHEEAVKALEEALKISANGQVEQELKASRIAAARTRMNFHKQSA